MGEGEKIKGQQHLSREKERENPKNSPTAKSKEKKLKRKDGVRGLHAQNEKGRSPP